MFIETYGDIDLFKNFKNKNNIFQEHKITNFIFNKLWMINHIIFIVLVILQLVFSHFVGKVVR